MTRIGVIGAGYWGPNLIRSFCEIPEADVVAVADRDPARLDHIHRRHDQIRHLVRDHHELFELGLDAVVVATPPETHADIASQCLREGLDVFVEKPLAIRPQDALALMNLADSMDRIVMVGHIAAYNPAVRALKEMVDSGELGEIRYVDAVRAGLGLFHPRLNVLWDLGPHDIAILLYVFGEMPITASTHGIACVQKSVEDVVYTNLSFADGTMAHLRMSWLDPYKSRRFGIVGSKKMVVYDDLEPQEKLKVYDKCVTTIRQTDTFGDSQFAYHYGSVVSPYIEFQEPLRLECEHFLECVAERRQPLTDARNGFEVVRVVEAAQRSLRLHGAEVPIDAVGALDDVIVLDGDVGAALHQVNGDRDDHSDEPLEVLQA